MRDLTKKVEIGDEINLFGHKVIFIGSAYGYKAEYLGHSSFGLLYVFYDQPNRNLITLSEKEGLPHSLDFTGKQKVFTANQIKNLLKDSKRDAYDFFLDLHFREYKLSHFYTLNGAIIAGLAGFAQSEEEFNHELFEERRDAIGTSYVGGAQLLADFERIVDK